MSEEKKEQKIDLKDKMLSDDDLNQVAGGVDMYPDGYMPELEPLVHDNCELLQGYVGLLIKSY